MASDFTVDRASKKYVLGADGFLKEYANDEPAIEFNADGSYKGVLVEPQSINDCLQSENFSTTWLNNNSTETSVALTAPDGTSNVYKLAVTAAGVGRIQQTVSGLTAAATHTASVFCKVGDVNWVKLQIQDADGASADFAYFNISTGAKGSSSGLVNHEIYDYANGWYRCCVTWNQGAADTECQFRIYPAEANNDDQVSAGNYIHIWGAQLELSPIATSYIPTTTGSVTRLKDDIYLTSASSLIGQTEGTMFVEVDWQGTAGASQFLLSINNDSSDNRLAVFVDSNVVIRMFARANAVTVTNQGESSTAYTGVQKIAFAYKTDDFELYRNGSSISTDTSGSLASLATLTNVDFGQNNSAGNQANMWIRAVALYTSRLSDTQCQDLTTL